MTPHEKMAERIRAADERLKAARKFWQERCKPGNPTNVAWLRRWEREFRSRWVERNNKFFPRES